MSEKIGEAYVELTVASDRATAAMEGVRQQAGVTQTALERLAAPIQVSPTAAEGIAAGLGAVTVATDNVRAGLARAYTESAQFKSNIAGLGVALAQPISAMERLATASESASRKTSFSRAIEQLTALQDKQFAAGAPVVTPQWSTGLKEAIAARRQITDAARGLRIPEESLNERGFYRASAAARDFSKSVQDARARANEFAATRLPVALGAVAAMGVGVLERLRWADALQDDSEALGVTTTAMQRLQIQADKTGLSGGRLNSLLDRLVNIQASAKDPKVAENLKAVGLEADKIRRMNLVEFQQAFGSALEKTSGDVRAMDAALELVGTKGGPKYIAFLKDVAKQNLESGGSGIVDPGVVAFLDLQEQKRQGFMRWVNERLSSAAVGVTAAFSGLFGGSLQEDMDAVAAKLKKTRDEAAATKAALGAPGPTDVEDPEAVAKYAEHEKDIVEALKTRADLQERVARLSMVGVSSADRITALRAIQATNQAAADEMELLSDRVPLLEKIAAIEREINDERREAGKHHEQLYERVQGRIESLAGKAASIMRDSRSAFSVSVSDSAGAWSGMIADAMNKGNSMTLEKAIARANQLEEISQKQTDKLTTAIRTWYEKLPDADKTGFIMREGL